MVTVFLTVEVEITDKQGEKAVNHKTVISIWIHVYIYIIDTE